MSSDIISNTLTEKIESLVCTIEMPELREFTRVILNENGSIERLSKAQEVLDNAVNILYYNQFTSGAGDSKSIVEDVMATACLLHNVYDDPYKYIGTNICPEGWTSVFLFRERHSQKALECGLGPDYQDALFSMLEAQLGPWNPIANKFKSNPGTPADTLFQAIWMSI